MDQKNSFNQQLFEYRYVLLFTAVMLQVFLSSFFPQRSIVPVNALVYSFFMLSTINLVRHDRRLIAIMLFFGILSVALVWAPEVYEVGSFYHKFEKIIVAAFITVIIYHIIIQIIRSKRIDGNVVIGAITIYVLFGLLAGEVNLLILATNHEAFAGNFDINNPVDLRYLGYVTVTTLGYGDITPVSPVAKAAAVFFALIAQIYLAVIIAFIVGKYVSHSSQKKD